MLKLSVAYALYNEEKNIVRSLDSLYDIADEIIIVDGKSTDNTIEVIKKYEESRLRSDKTSASQRKIKTFEYDNPSMFHINKQRALEKCTGDWILQMDADELLSPELKKEISVIASEAKQSQEIATSQAPRNDIVAYWIPRLNYFLGKPLRKGGQYPDPTIRLYRNGVAKFPCKSVHEQVEITPSVIPSPRSGIEGSLANASSIGTLKSNLLHYPYPSFTFYLEKWDRYNAQEAELLKKQGVKPSLGNFFSYYIVKPKLWFLKTYFRHKGFQDGFPGFVFSLFSAIRYWGIYTKLYERK